MDLAQYVQQDAAGDLPVDHDYLKKLINIPPEQLETERSGLHSRLATTYESQKALAANHMNDFVGTKPAIDALSKLLVNLSHSAARSFEVSLAAPRIPEKVYAALHELLLDDIVVYRQIDKIQELLTLPELVKDCVLKGDYNSALDLAGMTRRLEKRYPQSQLVSQLVHEVQRSVDDMREIFLDTLREASRLPLLTRAVAFLQRLDFTDLETAFIDSRWEYLKTQWEQIPMQLKQTQPVAYLKRVVEIYREHVFATINGFHTIFQDDRSSTDKALFKGEARLALFSRQALEFLLGALREHAPSINDKNERSSLWLQLAFCANSLGRIGADFWPLLDSSILSKEEWEEAAHHQRDMAGKVSKLAVGTRRVNDELFI